MNSARNSGPTAPSREQPRTSGSDDRFELEQFKRDIDLSAYAASRGYSIDTSQSSRRTRVMRCGFDKINISRTPGGKYVYYSFKDLDDNGTIVDFIAHRDHPNAARGAYPLGRIRQELRQWTGTERDLPDFARRPLEPTAKDLAQVEEMLARAKVQPSHPYLEARGLQRTTLDHPRFRGTWKVATGFYREGQWVPLHGDRGNVLFPHYNEQGVSGFEAKNRDFTGFAPGGEKAVWGSRVRPTDRVLVIAESAIDALSHHELSPNPHARYISFAGQLNPKQPALLERAVTWMPAGSTIVAATDKDKEGHEFARRIADICSRHPQVKFEREVPTVGKDWNDQLQDFRSRSRQVAPSSTDAKRPFEAKKNSGLER